MLLKQYLVNMEILACLSYLGIGIPNLPYLNFISGWLFCIITSWKYYKSKYINPRLMYLGGTLCYTLSVYWLNDSISFYYSLSNTSSFLGLITFSGINSLHFLLFGILSNLISKLKYCPRFLTLPVAYFVTQNLIPPYTHENIGTSQFSFNLLSQTADIWGTQGISFFLLLLSSFFCHLIFIKTDRKKIIFGILILISIISIRHTFIKYPNNPETINIGLIDPHKAQNKSLNQKDAAEQLNTLRKLSFELVSKNPEIDLLIWPESSLLFDIDSKQNSIHQSEEFYPLPGLHIPLLFGGQEKVETNSEKPKYYNSAIAILQNGNFSGKYRKQFLFPVSEYIPFRNFLSKAIPNINLEYEFIKPETPDNAIEISSSNKSFKLAPLICYDDLVSKSVRTYKGSTAPQLLITISNGTWFRDPTALMQHNDLARWRSIEYRQNFIRVSKNGISSGYDSYGREIFKFFPNSEFSYLAKDFPIEVARPTFFSLIEPYYFWFSLVFLVFCIVKKL